MRINRLVGLAVIALLVVGVMGAISLKVFAKGNPAPVAQVNQAPDCSQNQANDTTEANVISDTDKIDLQCGDQSTSDSQGGANDVYTDTTKLQQGEQDSKEGQDIATEVNSGTIQLQQGDQNSQDGQANGIYTDTAQVQEGDQNAPEVQDAGKGDTEGTTDVVTATLGTPAITADQAQAAALAANPGTTAVKTELDDENGKLIYSVELNNGLDVKVDAMTGAILSSENEQH
jgi:uncharacterized membrane protein YkoI